MDCCVWLLLTQCFKDTQRHCASYISISKKPSLLPTSGALENHIRDMHRTINDVVVTNAVAAMRAGRLLAARSVLDVVHHNITVIPVVRTYLRHQPAISDAVFQELHVERSTLAQQQQEYSREVGVATTFLGCGGLMTFLGLASGDALCILLSIPLGALCVFTLGTAAEVARLRTRVMQLDSVATRLFEDVENNSSPIQE